MSALRSYSPSPGPRYGGRVPVVICGISGAQNQECLPAFSSGPTGGLGIQNLPLLRFMNCAWLCRANASDADYAVGAAISRPKSLPPPRGKVPPKGADEGDLLVRIIYGGSYKGLPTQSETVPLTRKITVGATLAVARCGEAVPSVGAAHLGRPPATGFYSRSSDRPTR